MQPKVQEALSADIRRLGDLLGQTIRRLAGDDAFRLEEDVRAATKALRALPSLEEARLLRDRLGTLELRELRTLTRAFSIYFDLVNLAEQQARIRALRHRAFERGDASARETPEVALKQLRDRGIGARQLAEHLERFLVCPVFTAHPSEARRRTILEKLGAIAAQLDKIANDQLLPIDREEALDTIAEEIETLWFSETIRATRPTVSDEVRQGLGMVEGRLFATVPRVYRRLEDALKKVYPEQSWRVPSFLRFGSWIGGDRDGNPNVTHRTTVEAIRLQQETILRNYQARIDGLWRTLSHSDQLVRPSAIFQESLARDLALFPDEVVAPEHEPYRAKCRMIAVKLQKTLDYVRTHAPNWTATAQPPPRGVYVGPDGLLEDLRAIADDLRQVGATAAADGAIRDMIRLVEVFGLHMLTIDLRQHSDRHGMALDEIFRRAGVCTNYRGLTRDERLECLTRELQLTRPLIPAHLPFAPDTIEVVQTFRTTAAILEQQSPEALGTYIISSTTEPAHLLEVLLLAREARLFQPLEGISRIDIVPLFEALQPLQEGAAIMERLFELPIYRRQLELRGNIQEVMIGYSDSSKESGSLQSAWALYRAQGELAEVGRRKGITVQFFHGRGGAIGRGGGPAHRAILAQPRGTVNGRIRTTEQGEAIDNRYGHPAIAERHLEQVLNAVLLTSFPGDDPTRPEWVEALDSLAAAGCRHYRALVYDTPEFLTYFEQATCIEEIAQFKIGSRPARRGTATSIDQLRAIPWVFSWMQSRHTLPGWYGLGSAVRDYLAVQPDGLATLREMYQQLPFWTSLIDNAQMILAKADMTIARLYADLVADQALAARIYERIAGEYRWTVDGICLITGQEALLERAPVLRRTIEHRNPYVDPLSFVQLVLLKRLRSGEPPREELLTGVLESINGIAAGLQNTG